MTLAPRNLRNKTGEDVIATMLVDGASGLAGFPSGWAFDRPVVPAVTAGAYSLGDIVGGLLTFADVAPADGKPIIITGAHIACKADVNLNPKLHLFTADPSSTTKTDNAAYSLNTADVFKHFATISGMTREDHGTPNTWQIDNLGLIVCPVARAIYGLLLDGTGVTLASTSDIQVRLRGGAY